MVANDLITRPAVGGLHHVTAVTGDGQRNVDFYTKTLAMRLVKVTINYDDPGTYHLYFGDRVGSPGSLITFFVWAGGFGGKRGTGEVGQTAYAVPTSAISFWKERLAKLGLKVEESVRYGQTVLAFADPDGLAVELVGSESDAVNPQTQWATDDVPAAVAIRGLHSVTLQEVVEELPASVLVDQFGYRRIGQEGNRVRFEIDAPDNQGRIVDVIVNGVRKFAGGGAGSVHHVAFRTATDEQQASWLELLRKEGAHVSPIMDRDYFHSIYFREPGGVLFEIATDTPGMLTNETVETLGTTLSLPAWLEGARAEIEKGLPAIERAAVVKA